MVSQKSSAKKLHHLEEILHHEKNFPRITKKNSTRHEKNSYEIIKNICAQFFYIHFTIIPIIQLVIKRSVTFHTHQKAITSHPSEGDHIINFLHEVLYKIDYRFCTIILQKIFQQNLITSQNQNLS